MEQVLYSEGEEPTGAWGVPYVQIDRNTKHMKAILGPLHQAGMK